MRLAVVCSGAGAVSAVAVAAAGAPSGTAVPFTAVTIEPIVGVVKTTTNKKFQRKIMWRQMRRVATCQRPSGRWGRFGGWFASCGCHQLKFMLQCEILRDRWNNTTYNLTKNKNHPKKRENLHANLLVKLESEFKLLVKAKQVKRTISEGNFLIPFAGSHSLAFWQSRRQKFTPRQRHLQPHQVYICTVLYVFLENIKSCHRKTFISTIIICMRVIQYS